MRAIKVAVIAMSVLILAGFVVIAVTLVARLQSSGRDNAAAPFRSSVALPPGAKVVDMRLGDETVLLRLANERGDGWLLILSAETGREAGRVTLVADRP